MTDQVSTEETIFNKEETTQVNDQKTVPPTPGTKIDQPDFNAVFKDQLSGITDDNGEQKYKDVMTALEALKHTQQHVKTLEEENKQFRTAKTQQETLDTALQNISAKKEPETTKSEAIDAEQLKGMTLETLMEYEKSKAQEANKQTVSDSLVRQYGDIAKAKQAYSDKANELGINVETLVELAGQSPKAALAYFNSTSESVPSSTKGSINTQALTDTGKKDEVDYTARYFNTRSPSVDKWREAGGNLTN